MRWAKKEREKFYSQILFLSNPRQKIPKKKKSKKIQKIKKVNSGIISIRKGLTEAEKERKEIQSQIPSFSTRARKFQQKKQKNSKIKKVNSGIISIQNGSRMAEKERKNFQFRIPFILDPSKKIPKNIANKFKNLKNLFLALFLAKTGCDWPRKRKKKIIVPNSILTQRRQENSEKSS